MFRRKEKKNIEQPQPAPAPVAPSPPPKPVFTYSPDMLELQEMQMVESQTILDGEQNAAFSKLVQWLNLHVFCVPYLYFRVNSGKMDEKFSTFKQNVLRALVMEGIDLIKKHETLVKQLDNNTSSSAARSFVITNYINMPTAMSTWRSIKEHDFSTLLLKREINTIITLAVRDLKITAANLVSLLTSVDAIPLNYIPIIRFSELDLSTSEIVAARPICSLCTQKIIEIQQLNSELFTTLNDLTQLYADQSELSLQNQRNQLKNIFSVQKQFYDQESNSMMLTARTDKFEDLIFHPNFVCHNLILAFLQKPDAENYWNAVNDILAIFQIEEDDKPLFLALCSYVLPNFAAPTLKFDGLGSDNAEQQNHGSEFLATTDPIQCLHQIKTIGVRQLALIAQSFTTDWKSLYQFAVDFTDSQLIPSVAEIRQSIIETVLSK